MKWFYISVPRVLFQTMRVRLYPPASETAFLRHDNFGHCCGLDGLKASIATTKILIRACTLASLAKQKLKLLTGNNSC